MKDPQPDTLDTVRDRDARQVGAVFEGKSPDAGDRIPSYSVQNN